MDEQQLDELQRLVRVEAELHYVKETVEKAAEKIDKLERKLERYEGKLGGIFMVLVALGALLKWLWIEKLGVWNDLKSLFGKGP